MLNILFFITHQPNPRFAKQINFLAKKNKVSLIHFNRESLHSINDSISKNVTIVNLGTIPNASKPVKRILVYFKLLGKLINTLKKINYNLIVINNIDGLILFKLATFKLLKRNKKPKVTLEISDLREFVFSKSIPNRIIQFIERKLYKKYVDKLIVTSEKFYSYHFKNFYTKKVFVLENKLLKDINNQKKIKRLQKDKVTIGIIGALFRLNEYRNLIELYKNSNKINIYIYGKGDCEKQLKNYADKYSNVYFFGKYNGLTETKKIYEKLDIIYLVYDTTKESLNNQLALPNKLYESMCYKVPLICSENTYLAKIVNLHKIGVSIDCKNNNALEEAVNYVIENKNKLTENLENLNENLFFGDEDYLKLELFLKN